MRNTLLERLYATGLLVIFGLIVLHAPMTVFFGSSFPGYDLIIKSWKEILMVLLIPVAILFISQKHAWRQFIHDPIIWLLGGYALIHFVLLTIQHQGAAATLAGLAVDLRYALFFTLVYGLLQISPQYRSLFLKIGGIGAAIVIGFGTLQLFLPPDILTHIGYGAHTIAPYLTVDDNPAFIRINSTLRGPNPLGIYAVLVLALVVAFWVKGRATSRLQKVFASILGVCILIVLWNTYSRSALIAAGISVGIVVLVRYGRTLHRWVWIAAVSLVVLFVGILYAARDSTFVSNVLLHNATNTGAAVTSDEQHAASLVDGIRLAIQHPLGAGIGSTGSASLQGSQPLIIENQYLFTAHEVGWLGLIVFVSLFILILVKISRRKADWLALGIFASGVGIGIVGLLQPIWVDDTVSILWWGLAAIALTREIYDAKTTK